MTTTTQKESTSPSQSLTLQRVSRSTKTMDTLRFKLLAQRCHDYGIPPIVAEHSRRLFKEALDKKVFRGSRDGLLAMCMYRACKDNHAPRSIKEVAEIFNVEEQVLMKGNRSFDNLTREDDDDEDCSTVDSLVRPSHFVTRFSRRMGLPAHVVSDISRVTMLVETKGILPDCAPVSIAAAVIVLVCQMHSLTVKKVNISAAAQISVVTINNCFKKLDYFREYIHQEISAIPSA